MFSFLFFFWGGYPMCISLVFFFFLSSESCVKRNWIVCMCCIDTICLYRGRKDCWCSATILRSMSSDGMISLNAIDCGL